MLTCNDDTPVYDSCASVFVLVIRRTELNVLSIETRLRFTLLHCSDTPYHNWVCFTVLFHERS